MTSERGLDKKEKRIGVKPAGIITLGTGENQRHYLLDADHLDTLAATSIKKEEIDTVIAVTGEQSHLRFPELEPEKVTFVQIEGSAISAREHLGGIGKKSKVIFTLHGRNMATDDAHSHDIDEQVFSHLFLEPERGDTMDFRELPRNNGDTDFLIIHHDQVDPARATIYFLANQAVVVEDQLSQSKPKVDLLQFVDKVHQMMVNTGVPDFTHLPEQAKVEDAIHQALANGNLSLDGYTKTTFDALPRDAKILGFIYRLQAQFALRGSERYTDNERGYYKQKLQQLVPFSNSRKSLWSQFKRRNEKIAFGMTKWDELTYDLSNNNVCVAITQIHPEKPDNKALDWETRWTEDLPLDEVGRLNATEQNDYLANRLVALITSFEKHLPNNIDGQDVMNVWKQIEQFSSLVTTVNRSRVQQDNVLPWPLDYSSFYNRLNIGSFNAHSLIPFLNKDEFNLALSRKPRYQIVKHTIDQWKSTLSIIKRDSDVISASGSMKDLERVSEGLSGYLYMTPAYEIRKAITELYKFNNETPPRDLNPYHFSELVLIAKTLFVFAAEYHQLKEENRAHYNLNTWTNQLNKSLKALQEIRLGI